MVARKHDWSGGVSTIASEHKRAVDQQPPMGVRLEVLPIWLAYRPFFGIYFVLTDACIRGPVCKCAIIVAIDTYLSSPSCPSVWAEQCPSHVILNMRLGSFSHGVSWGHGVDGRHASCVVECNETHQRDVSLSGCNDGQEMTNGDGGGGRIK